MVPVLVQTPPTASLRSMMPTFLPSLAAWTAAFWPAGPVPMTRRSYWPIRHPAYIGGRLDVERTVRGSTFECPHRERGTSDNMASVPTSTLSFLGLASGD